MTHPDTLTIPRAVVEQALAICDSLQRYDGTLTGAQVIATAEALRAALQPQAAAEPVNEWREAVLDAVAAYSMDFRMDVPPCVIVNQLLGMAATAPITCQYCHSDSGEVMWHCNNCGNKDQPYTTPLTTQAAPVSLQAAHDAVTIDTLDYRVMRQQAALTAALEALKEIASMEGTESNEWDGVERVIPEMCAVAKAAIAQLEALASGSAGNTAPPKAVAVD